MNPQQNRDSILQGLPSPSDGCPLCEDGLIIKENVAYPCKCQEQRRLERLFAASKITPAFRAKTFDNFKTQGRPPIINTMLKSAMDYVARLPALGENNWLALLGEPGSGKTHLAMATANTLVAQGMQALYFPHVEGMGELMSGIDDKTISKKTNTLKNVALLLWDDFLKPIMGGRPKEFEMRVAFEVVNYRYLNLLPTVISSEHSPQGLLNMDKATGSRIIERSKGHLTVALGEELNYRLHG
jgi:DNA replication protein DnaC